MARILRYRPKTDKDGMRVGGAEGIVFVVIVLGLIFGVRYYFTVYVKSAGYALSAFVGAVKAGNPEIQYGMLVADEQGNIGSVKNYEKQVPLGRGYATRIENFSITEEKPNPQDPSEVTLKASVTLRGAATGKQLYQSSSQSVTDSYVLRKDAKGEWKISLAKSNLGILQATPNPPGDPIGNGN